MMNGAFFEKLCIVGARVRKDPRPFGGIQLICSGDFFQLPVRKFYSILLVPLIRAQLSTSTFLCM